MNIKLGVIGTGNMGQALVERIVSSGLVHPDDIYLYDVDSEKAASFAEKTGAIQVISNTKAAKAADVLLVAVKPQQIKGVLNEISPFMDEKKIIISIAAGISYAILNEASGGKAQVIRAMPNMPALIGEGVTLLSHPESTSKYSLDIAIELFRCSGIVEILPESMMNKIIALTGSSPAYVFMFIEAMADEAVRQGIPRNLAYKLASAAVKGSAGMVLSTGIHPAELKDRICSPGGTTIEAVNSLEKNGFRHAVMEAMSECTKRAEMF